MEPSLEIQGDALPATQTRGHHMERRLIAGLFFAPALALLIVAATLKPDPRGVDTHVQLGLPACGFLREHGIPCATCGMTTAFALAADGNLIAAFITQPAGAILAVVTAMIVLLTGWSMMTGASLRPFADAAWRPLTVVLLGGLVLAGWGFKILTYHGTH